MLRLDSAASAIYGSVGCCWQPVDVKDDRAGGLSDVTTVLKTVFPGNHNNRQQCGIRVLSTSHGISLDLSSQARLQSSPEIQEP